MKKKSITYTTFCLLLLFLNIYPWKAVFAQDECMEKIWEWGVSRRVTAYHTADLDNDGNSELIIGSSALVAPSTIEKTWQVYDYVEEIGTYASKYFTRSVEGTILSISTYDYNQDGFLDLFFLVGSYLRIINGKTFEELDRIALQRSGTNAYFFDIDKDGSTEMVFSHSNGGNSGYSIIDLEDSLSIRSFNSGGFTDIRNVDDDPEPEAISYKNSGYSIGIFDFDSSGTTLTRRIDVPRGNSGIKEIKVLDMDSDGKDEIIVAQRTGNEILFYDVDSSSIKWTFLDSTARLTHPMTHWDVNGDGTQDLLFAKFDGAGSYRGLSVLDMKNRQVLWELDSLLKDFHKPEDELTAVNLDADSAFELLVFRDPFLAIYDLNPSKITFDVPSIRSENLHMATHIDDVDSDGELEYIVAGPIYAGINNELDVDPFRNGNYGGTINIFNSETHLPEFTSYLRKTQHFINQPNDIAVGDIDNDGVKEIIIVGQAFFGEYHGRMTILNGDDYSVDTTIILEDFLTVTNVEIADIENDGQKELIISVWDSHAGPMLDYFVYALNGSDLSSKFKVSDFPYFFASGVYSMRTGDIDEEPGDEIVFQMTKTFVGRNDHTYVVKLDSLAPSGVRLDTIFYAFQGYGLDLKDMTGDGIDDIISGNTQGEVKIYDYAHDSLIWSEQVAPASIYSVRAHDVDGDSNNELILAAGGALAIYDIEEDTLSCLNIFDSRFGFYNNLHIGDKNEDGILEIFGSGISSAIEYELTGFAPVGIEKIEKTNQQSLLAYPNPNKGEFILKLNEVYSTPLSIRVFNINGALIDEKYARTNNSSEISLNLENEKPGIYIIQILDNQDLIGYAKVFIN